MSSDREIREKIVVRGAGALTDAELLSILIQNGNGGPGAIETAEQLLNTSGGKLSVITQTDPKQLRSVGGIGLKTASLLAAAFEIGRRVWRENAEQLRQVRTEGDVADMFRPLLTALKHEELWAVYLSGASTVIEKTRISQGGPSAMAVDRKMVVKRAIEVLASGIILVHNHPSGIALPSGEDISLTEKIKEAALLFDIEVLDHIIITPAECFSFRNKGLL